MNADPGPNGYTTQTFNPQQWLTHAVTQYQGALLRMCYICLRDQTAAEDAVQETFLKAYRSLGSFRGASTERSWLTSIAINTCRDMQRSAWFRHTDRRFTPEELPFAAPGDNHEDALALAEAISRLPQRHRDVVLLYYYHDMTVQEVAAALGAAPSTITKRLKQAREKLRGALEDRPGEALRQPRPLGTGKEGWR